jgi:hypothetical protein
MGLADSLMSLYLNALQGQMVLLNGDMRRKYGGKPHNYEPLYPLLGKLSTARFCRRHDLP